MGLQIYCKCKRAIRGNEVRRRPLKESKLPVTFHAENGNLYSYASTTRYEAFDEIEVKEKPEKDFCIGFNPSFLVDIMSIVDSEYPVFYGTKEVCPWTIKEIHIAS